MTITQAGRSSTTSRQMWCWANMPATRRRLTFPDDCRRIKLAAINGALIGMAIATDEYADGSRWFRFHISNTADGREAAQLIADDILDSANVSVRPGDRVTVITLSRNIGPVDIGPSKKAIERRNALARLAALDH